MYQSPGFWETCSTGKREGPPVPTLRQAQQLKEFAQEIFDLTKVVWAAQAKAKSQSEAEVSEAEFLALDLLSLQEPQTVGDLQRQIGVLPAQMSRIIRSLEQKGDQPLISCQINAEDKRKIDVSLTQAGKSAHEAYRKMKLGTIEKMLLSLNEQDRNEFMRILRLIRQQANEATK
jgi:DNA-binding MarR family transcriptional regulator